MLLLDLGSKAWAFESLAPHEQRSVISGWLEFRRSLNDGAVFGSFTGYTELFVLASVAAMGFVLYLFFQGPPRQYGQHVALALILAGALGNLYDRSFIKGDVVRVRREGTVSTAMIGVCLGEPEGEIVQVGDWPEGTNPRVFRTGEVNIVRQGVVRDFIKFVPILPSWVPFVGGRDVWPWVFNVADSALVCGVCYLLVSSWFGSSRPTARSPGAGVQSSESTID